MLRVVWSLGSRTCRRVDEFEERVEGSRSRDAKGRGAVSERSPQLACGAANQITVAALVVIVRAGDFVNGDVGARVGRLHGCDACVSAHACGGV